MEVSDTDGGRHGRLLLAHRTAVAGLLVGLAACAPITADQPTELRRTAESMDRARSFDAERRREINSTPIDLDRSLGSRVVKMATPHLGTPYVWGGTGPSGFDCSGFVRYVYAEQGILLPRTVKDQYQVGTAVRRDGLQPGDIVFFDRLRHNGVYIGNNRLIHASTQARIVRITSLDDEWFSRRWVGARRPSHELATNAGAVTTRRDGPPPRASRPVVQARSPRGDAARSPEAQ